MSLTAKHSQHKGNARSWHRLGAGQLPPFLLALLRGALGCAVGRGVGIRAWEAPHPQFPLHGLPGITGRPQGPDVVKEIQSARDLATSVCDSHSDFCRQHYVHTLGYLLYTQMLFHVLVCSSFSGQTQPLLLWYIHCIHM